MAKRIRVDMETAYGWFDDSVDDYVYNPEAGVKPHQAEYSVPDGWVCDGALTREGQGEILTLWFGPSYLTALEPTRILVISFRSEVLGDVPEDQAEELLAQLRQIRQDHGLA